MSSFEIDRRSFLRLGAFTTLSLLAPWRLASADDSEGKRPGGVIVLWLGGGLLGGDFDGLATGDPKHPLPDVGPSVPFERVDRRMKDLSVVDAAFAQGRGGRVEATGHAARAQHAITTMKSPRLQAFDYKKE